MSSDRNRRGRGRLSSIEQLPPEAEPFVAAAIQALNERSCTAEEIRGELNAHLLSLPDCEPISRSAFNRYSLQLAASGRRIAQAREMASIFAEKIDEMPDGDIGLLLVETIKTMIYDVMMDATLDGESPSIKMLVTAAEAVERLEKARNANVRTAKLKRDNFVEDAATAAVEAATKRGLSAETVDQIKHAVLGVKS